MNQLYFLLIFLTFNGLFLHTTWSAEENPTYLKWSGEYRTRYEFLLPPSGEGTSSLNTFSHRLIFSSNFKPEENIEIKASLLLSENLGQDYKGFAGYKVNTSQDESVSIYELYANWLANSGLGFQVGRFLFNNSNDNIFSKNLDDAIPTRFDGGLLKYDKDFFNFSGGVFVVSQFQNAQLKTETSRLYLVSVDLKINENLFKNINFSFISYDTKENTIVDLNNFTFPEQSFTMYSASLTGEYERFFYDADVAIQQGDNKTTNQLMDNSMLNGTLGMTLHLPSKLKVFSQFHRDTGDVASTTETNESYNPMFYNHFLNAGRMNLLGWGNLTSYSLGLSRKWSDKTTVHLEYISFLRTSPDSGINGLSATGLTPLTSDNSGNNTGPFNNILASLKKNIGDEIDLVIDYTSPIGLKFQSITGVFLPGAYLKDYSKTDTIFFQRFGLEFLF